MTGVAIIGAGMTAFGRHPDRSLGDLGREAATRALEDAGLAPSDIEMAFVANTAGGVITGQVAVVGQVVMARIGVRGIPVYNIENACAGSATALNLATMAVRSGAAALALVVGVEKLYSDDRTKTYRALNGAADVEWARTTGADLDAESVFVREVYPQRLRAYAARYGLEPSALAAIAVKNRRHAATNPLAQYRTPMTIEQVLEARMVTPPLTTLMCAPVGDGASAIVITSAERAKRYKTPVWLRASIVSMGDSDGTLRRLGDRAYATSGLRPGDVNVAELHDATAFGELLATEELRLVDRGSGAQAVQNGSTSLGGRIPVNTSGGLLSRGHPIAASGIAQTCEIVWQLRGEARERQVDGATVGLTEIAGGFVGGDSAAIAVHLLASRPA
jgi:acetyl-CoA acyltransferase